MIHNNSLSAYVAIVPSLSKRQHEVLKIFKDDKQYTDKEIAKILGLEINQITGRITELISKKEIAEVGRVYVGSRPRRVCQIVKQTLF